VSSFADANTELVKERVGELFPEQFSPPLRQQFIARLASSPANLLRWFINSRYGVFISGADVIRLFCMSVTYP